MSRVLLILFLSSISIIETRAQIVSNQYYEVVDSCFKTERRTTYIGNDEFISYPNSRKITGPVYLIDSNRVKIELPCDQMRWNGNWGNFQCRKGNTGALFSANLRKPISPFYDSIRIYNPDFYSIQENGDIKIFNSENELIFQKPLSSYNKKPKISACDQYIQVYDYEKGFTILNKKGELMKGNVCNKNMRNFIFRNGTYKFKKDGKYGVKKEDGTVLIKPMYKNIWYWKGKRYIVSIKHGEFYGSLSGVINTKGKAILPIQYKWIRNHEDVGITIKKDEKLVFLNGKLKDVYRKEFDNINVLKCGIIKGEIGEKKYYDLLFTKENEIKSETINFAYEISEDRCLVHFKNGFYIIYDSLGNEIFKTKEKVNAARHVVQNTIAIHIDFKKRGLIDKHGKWIVEPGKFGFKAADIKDGIFKFDIISFKERGKVEQKRELINTKGEVIYPDARFVKFLTRPKNYIIKSREGIGVIDEQGNILIPFGNYEIFEFYAEEPLYYRLSLEEKAFVVKLKKQ